MTAVQGAVTAVQGAAVAARAAGVATGWEEAAGKATEAGVGVKHSWEGGRRRRERRRLWAKGAILAS